MNRLVALLLFAFLVEGNAAVLFNVNFDSSSDLPSISDGGGGFPAPIGAPVVTTLTANPPNTTHLGSILGQALWMQSYSTGDYFSFRLLADPYQQIRMTGIWFGVATDLANGPSSVSVDFISIGGTVSQQVASGTFGLEFFDVLSDASTVEVRFSGFGGAGDIGPGPHESFGIEFISASFEVVPEPSASLLFVLAGVVYAVRRKRKM